MNRPILEHRIWDFLVLSYSGFNSPNQSITSVEFGNMIHSRGYPKSKKLAAKIVSLFWQLIYSYQMPDSWVHKWIVTWLVNLHPQYWSNSKEYLFQKSRTNPALSSPCWYVLVIPHYHYVIKSTPKQALVAVVWVAYLYSLAFPGGPGTRLCFYPYTIDFNSFLGWPSWF